MTKTHLLVSASVALTLSALALGHPRRPAHADSDQTVHDAAARLRARLSHAHPLEGSPLLAAVDVEALGVAKQSAPVQLVLVLDHSGSMAGDKMSKAKAAALKLIDMLGEQDSLAVVAFDSAVSHTAMREGDAAGKQELRGFVEALEAGSGTNIWAGLEQARALLDGAYSGGVHRVILVSDGQPTEGRTSAGELSALVSGLREQVGPVSALGVGVDFNGPLMTQLAAMGGGFYGYLKDTGALAEVLSRELDQARHESLSRVTVELETTAGTRIVDVPGRSFTPTGSGVRVALPNLAPGQSETLYVRLQSLPGGDPFALRARLHYRGQDSEQSLLAHAAATPTADADYAKDGVDQALADQSLRIEGSQKMVQAAEAFQRGDRANAFALLDNARSLFSMSADALAGDIAENESMKTRWGNTVDADAVKHEALQYEQKSMKNFGENNAY